MELLGYTRNYENDSVKGVRFERPKMADLSDLKRPGASGFKTICSWKLELGWRFKIEHRAALQIGQFGHFGRFK